MPSAFSGLGRKVFWASTRLMHQGVWNVVGTIGPVNRFRDQTLGLVGVGRRGKRFAQMASPHGASWALTSTPPRTPGRSALPIGKPSFGNPTSSLIAR